jgi:hypothetical protein
MSKSVVCIGSFELVGTFYICFSVRQMRLLPSCARHRRDNGSPKGVTVLPLHNITPSLNKNRPSVCPCKLSGMVYDGLQTFLLGSGVTHLLLIMWPKKVISLLQKLHLLALMVKPAAVSFPIIVSKWYKCCSKFSENTTKSSTYAIAYPTESVPRVEFSALIKPDRLFFSPKGIRVN